MVFIQNLLADIFHKLRKGLLFGRGHLNCILWYFRKENAFTTAKLYKCMPDDRTLPSWQFVQAFISDVNELCTCKMMKIDFGTHKTWPVCGVS